MSKRLDLREAEADDPTLFDLSLNTGALEIEVAAELVVTAMLRRFPPLD